MKKHNNLAAVPDPEPEGPACEPTDAQKITALENNLRVVRNQLLKWAAAISQSLGE